MKNFTVLLMLCIFAFQTASSQILFKLEKLDDQDGWGVYAKHNGDGQTPSKNIDLGSAQATIVVSTGFTMDDVTSVNGIWSQNATVRAPIENPAYDYFSFGYDCFFTTNPNFPSDGLSIEDETLLFTFSTIGDCPDEIRLFDNVADPFLPPNSASNNPGNNFDVIDKGFLPNLYIYGYNDIYEDCKDLCDGCNQRASIVTPSHFDNKLKISPNPNNGQFTIDLKDITKEVQNFTIINNLGQVVYKTDEVSNNNQVSLNVPQGIYNILFELKNKSFVTKRIIISK